MTILDSSPEMVSAVRIAMTLPMTLLAIPAGMLVDRLDRRRLLIATQWTLLVCASALSALTWTEAITSTWLLLLTFCSGVAMVMHVLAWQAAIPQLVPREQLSRAIALGSISFNLARSVGPAVGGLLIASVGIWSTFATNALSFAGVLLVLMFWKPSGGPRRKTESSFQSICEGFVHVLAKPELRNSLFRLASFVLPASVFWALLPLVIRERLLWDERGYGFVVTLLGVGAVIAALFLHRLHQLIGMHFSVVGSMLVYALGLVFVGTFSTGLAISAVTLVMGAAWMITFTTLNSAMQISLTDQMRGRGMSFYYASMAGSMAVGSCIWGQIAGGIHRRPHTALGETLLLAATAMFIATILGLRFPIGSSPEKDTTADRETELSNH